MIRDLHEPVCRTVHDGGFQGPHNAPITWHHLLQQTSEWEGELWGKPDLIDRHRSVGGLAGAGKKGTHRDLQPPGRFWEDNDVRVFQHRRARGARRLRMRVGEQSLSHAHGQERNAALLDERADRLVGLRIGRPLAENDQRPLGSAEHIQCPLDRGWRGKLRGRRIDDLDQGLRSGVCVYHLREKLGRQIEIDAARTAG